MLITLEGLDGSGKTSAWDALRDDLTDADGTNDSPHGTVFTREPTDSWYGQAVSRSIADDDADPMAELFLYTADHADHLHEVIEPALSAGRVVISDRYSDSRYAYQGVSLAGVVDDPMEYVETVHDPWTRPPDATVYLDVDPETAAERSGVTNKFETAEHLQRVRENYEMLVDAEPDRFVRVDAGRPLDTVLADVSRCIEELLE